MAARQPALALLLQILLCATTGAPYNEDFVGGQAAIDLLRLDAARIPVPGAQSPQRLEELLLRDRDLRVSRSSRRLAYVCAGGLLAHSHNHSRGQPSRRRPLSHDSLLEGAARRLRQLPQADLADPSPSSVQKDAAGLPLLHRWARAPGPRGKPRMGPAPALAEPRCLGDARQKAAAAAVAGRP
jgi:hypothetical protein